MNLYFMPGACSLASHIILHELGVEHNLIRVDGASKRTADGKDYLQINPNGYVPALQLDDGRVLTEGPAILQYLADSHADKDLAPQCGSFERAKLQQWLNYTGTELHKNFGPLFAAAATPAEKQAATAKLEKRLQSVERQLEKTPYLLGDKFSVADAYLYVILRWASQLSLPLESFPSIRHYQERLAKRPGIIAAQKDEGLA
ncbi:glutathione transferase GstA [Candidatus Tokpelaia sp.]|uniref:glutathione transferase GstA n=1 Tax=Candidatus Tokpelaia sp. TaxID=2233777 RepID=UPI001239EB1F|nr:glutathione transferase GstA [Candidatus Tokpelaia sp.]KAA6405951.1 glutathione transferase GstA [Candidatus Tokpelaia sp.]